MYKLLIQELPSRSLAIIISTIKKYKIFHFKSFLWISGNGHVNLNMLYIYISINMFFFQELPFHENTRIRDIYFPRDPEVNFENASSYPQKSRITLLTYKVSI